MTPTKTVETQSKRRAKKKSRTREESEKEQLLKDARARLAVAIEEIRRMIRHGEDEALAAWRDERDIWEEKIARLEGRGGRDH